MKNRVKKNRTSQTELEDELITLAFNEYKRTASKDVDQIRDTGGKFQRNQSDRPGRDDLKKHKRNPRKMLKQDRQDYKDTLFDKDLKD